MLHIVNVPDQGTPFRSYGDALQAAALHETPQFTVEVAIKYIEKHHGYFVMYYIDNGYIKFLRV